MAWNPNDEYSYAWFTKVASEHGGVEPYINDIEENARAEGFEEGREEAHKEDMRLFVIAVGIGILGKTLYDKFKLGKAARKELKQKSDVAKENLVNGANVIKDNQTDEIDFEEEEDNNERKISGC